MVYAYLQLGAGSEGAKHVVAEMNAVTGTSPDRFAYRRTHSP